MNNTWATTGLVPLCIGSTETFQLDAKLDGLPWDLTNGAVLLKLVDPNSAVYSVTGTGYNSGATAPWTIAAPAGTWLLAWDCTDQNGVRQVSDPIPFVVLSSPI